MADNVPFQSDLTKVIATDEISGVHYQILKLAFGALDTATLVTSGSGLPVTQAVPPDQVAALTDGRKTVTAAGTAEAIRASLACKWVTVTALLTNTSQVNIGGSGVLATLGASNGTPLLPGSSITIPIDNASKVFVDARVSSEGVSFTVGA
jgi:hypothetical protein